MSEIKRWYDKSAKLSDLMEVMSNMSDKEIDLIAQYLYQVVNLFWKQKKATEQDSISIGREKLFSYYKSYQKRRWYDRNPSLSGALNIMSTLSEKEMDEIVDGFIFALKDAGLYKIYSSRKEGLKEKESK